MLLLRFEPERSQDHATSKCLTPALLSAVLSTILCIEKKGNRQEKGSHDSEPTGGLGGKILSVLW